MVHRNHQHVEGREKARGLEVEDFGGGIVGFRLPEEGAEAPKQVKAAGRRKAAG